MRRHNRRADLQPRLAPFPIAPARAARQREYFPKLFRRRDRRHLKRRREVRFEPIQFFVEQDVEIQRQIRAGVAATAVEARQFVKANGIRGAVGRVEQHGHVFTGDAGKLKQFGGVQLPTDGLAGRQRFDMAGNPSVRPGQFQRFNPFVTDLGSGSGFLIDKEGHDFSSGLPPGF